MKNTKNFASRWGFILASVGSAVGMANVWGFPNKLGSNGGGAFLLIYLLFVFIFSYVGLPAEFAMGRHAATGTLGAYEKAWSTRGKGAGKAGGLLGWLPLAGSLCIAFGYAVIVTYILKALVDSLVGTLMTTDTASWFGTFSSTPYSVIPYHIIVVVGTLLTLYLGAHSIEKTNKIMMPLFFIIFLILAVRVAMLPGAVLGALMSFIAGRLFDRYGVRKLAIPGGVLTLAGAFGMAALGIDASILSVAAVYTVMVVGLQTMMTPLNTWGVNSLDNELVQHATAVSNTMNQVGGSLGTALIMSFSAIGLSMAAPGASPVEQLATSYHLSFTAVLALALIVLVLVALCVRNRKDDKDPVRGSSTTVDPAGVQHTVAEVMDAHPLTIPASATWARRRARWLPRGRAVRSWWDPTDRSRASCPTATCFATSATRCRPSRDRPVSWCCASWTTRTCTSASSTSTTSTSARWPPSRS